MTTTPTDPQLPRRPRRFGAGALAGAALAAAVLAAGGTWLLARPHEHGPATAEAKNAAAELWTCPMHPSVVQDHPGDCPICGMKLVKVGPAAEVKAGGASAQASGQAAPAEQWQCPMHPNVVQ